LGIFKNWPPIYIIIESTKKDVFFVLNYQTSAVEVELNVGGPKPPETPLKFNTKP